MGKKLIKDPIYGYIPIPSYAIEIINTASFQRLRNIRQTSYAPLYPSSLHNRFVHSLGVFHLGQVAAKTLMECPQVQALDEGILKSLKKTFLLACLLHDIGHAPFSHTGEGFFVRRGENNYSKEILEDLCSVVGDEEYQRIASAPTVTSAAPHEMMSVILGIKVYGEYIAPNDTIENRDFFARCITGYLYDDTSNDTSRVKNCFIGLLHSSLIDVDRLDYVIRDSYYSGFQSVSIDYMRLLQGITIAKTDDGE